MENRDKDWKERRPMLSRKGSTEPRRPSKLEHRQSTVSAGHGKDHRCGVSGCYPHGVQGCANIKAYTAALSVLLVLNFVFLSYSTGVVRTVEKRFGLQSYETGLVMSMSDIVQTVLVLVVGYLGRKTHKPRYLSISALFSALGMFIGAMPYFIYGPYQYDPALIASHKSMTSAENAENIIEPPQIDVLYQMCGAAINNGSSQTCNENGSQTEVASQATYALYYLIASSILMGFGTSGLFTLGISFIDENVKKEDSALYVGIVTSMFGLGPVIGFSLAAFCTGLPEDLGEIKVSQYDPTFIGCWWLGNVVVGCLLILASIPMFMFPKHFRAYYDHCKTGRKSITGSQKATVKTELKAFPKAVWLLLSNPAYMILTLSKVSAMYYITGVIINMSRYLEIHFRQPAFVANLASGVCGAITGAIGNVIGGVLMKKMQLQERGSARLMAFALGGTCVTVVIMMLMPCTPMLTTYDSQMELTKFGYDVDFKCNVGCDCLRDRYQPVCSPDGVAYFSPCHAGCQHQRNGTIFSNCSCLPADVADLSSEWCGSSCSLFIPYIVTYALTSLIGSIANVPITILTFRVVEPELKAFALGLTSSLYNILVFVPSPMIFGKLFDSACRLWKTSCGERLSCLLYDTATYRYYMHGVVVAFKVLALILAGVLNIVIVKRSRGYSVDEVNNNPDQKDQKASDQKKEIEVEKANELGIQNNGEVKCGGKKDISELQATHM